MNPRPCSGWWPNTASGSGLRHRFEFRLMQLTVRRAASRRARTWLRIFLILGFEVGTASPCKRWLLIQVSPRHPCSGKCRRRRYRFKGETVVALRLSIDGLETHLDAPRLRRRRAGENSTNSGRTARDPSPPFRGGPRQGAWFLHSCRIGTCCSPAALPWTIDQLSHLAPRTPACASS